MSVLPMPPLETAIIYVTHIASVEVGDRIRTTIDGRRVGYPPEMVQVATFSEWRVALCQRAKDLGKPLEVSYRNYGHGDRQLVLIEWAH